MIERKVKMAGWGNALSGKKLRFGDQTRYRLDEGETLLDLAETATVRALSQAGMEIGEIDCIVCGMATPLQAIPCNAALLHERMASHMEIPAMDINTTCTSFITALDMVSCLIAAGRYQTVLIVSGDTASAALNPGQKESYELFSDAASAFIITKTGEGESSEIIYGEQRTWSVGAHDTEIRGGGGLRPVFEMTKENREDYYFDMNGPRILKLTARKLPGFIEESFRKAGVKRDQLNAVIPHQASKALGAVMPRLGFSAGTYLDYVSEYGNMISASVPYTLCRAIQEGKVKRGDLVLLMGTAAGLTANVLFMTF